MTPQMACESQIWPRCTPRGITSLFRTKELIFETDRSKLSHFTRNYPQRSRPPSQCWSARCQLGGDLVLQTSRPSAPSLPLSIAWCLSSSLQSSAEHRLLCLVHLSHHSWHSRCLILRPSRQHEGSRVVAIPGVGYPTVRYSI